MTTQATPPAAAPAAPAPASPAAPATPPPETPPATPATASNVGWLVVAMLILLVLVLAGVGSLIWKSSGWPTSDTEAKVTAAEKEAKDARRELEDLKGKAVGADHLGFDLDNQLTEIRKHDDGDLEILVNIHGKKLGKASKAAAASGAPDADTTGPRPPTTGWRALLDDDARRIADDSGIPLDAIRPSDVRLIKTLKELEKAKASEAKVKADLETSKAEVARLSEARAKAEETAKAVDELKKSLQAVEGAKAKAEADHKKAADELDRFKAEKAKADSAEEKARLDASLGEARGALEECESKIAELSEQLKAAQTEATAAKAKAEALEKAASKSPASTTTPPK